MAYNRANISIFEAVEDGFLLAFDTSGAIPLATLRAIIALDPWQRCWLREVRGWWIADDAIAQLARKAPEVREALARWRERAASETASAATADWLRRARAALMPPTVFAAYVTLGLAPGAPEEAVVAARRTLARRAHPDVGGRHASMVAINLAADTVLDWLRQCEARTPSGSATAPHGGY